jgi:signal transduction histidine kinase
VLIRAHQAGSAIELRVADHGRGMSRATIARVFDPFFTTKADGLGGFGLPMVERFVRGAGGALTIVSELGVGTIVTLGLPAALPGNLPFPESDR